MEDEDYDSCTTEEEGTMENESNVYWSEVEDISINILLRLPVNSLVMCKSIFKGCRSLIESPEFIRSQFSLSLENPNLMFFLGREKELIKIDGGEIITRMPLPNGKSLKHCDLICSIHGLVFFSSHNRSSRTTDVENIHIWNPATQQLELLPASNAKSREKPIIRVVYEPSTNQYKIFRIVSPPKPCMRPRPPFPFPFGYGECEVYSSMTRCWKGMGRVDIFVQFESRARVSPNCISINGATYWFAGDIDKERDCGEKYVRSIVAVDLDEKFREIRLPRESIRFATLISLVNVEGCLYLISIHRDFRFNLWALNDDGHHNHSYNLNRSYDDESTIWIKKCSDDDAYPNSEEMREYMQYCPVARKKEILFMGKNGRLVYNIDSKSWNIKLIHCLDDALSKKDYSSIPFIFTESFISCNEATGRKRYD